MDNTENDLSPEFEIEGQGSTISEVEAVAGFEDHSVEQAAPAPDPHPSPSSGGVLAGAASVVAAAFGLASITGTWVALFMRDREQFIGELKQSNGLSQTDVDAIYGTPAHTYALFNGCVAILAVLFTGSLLLLPRFTALRTAPWMRAVCWAGLVLGVIGLAISAFFWFDVFTPALKLPSSGALQSQ